MDAKTSRVLLELNRRFYRDYADEFSATRQQPWQGWRHLLDRYAGRRDELSILDLGCGNGRFAVACDRQLSCDWRYVGIDGSPGLVKEARAKFETLEATSAKATVGDLLAGDRPLPRGPFDLVALFGLMHHVPGAAAREQLLAKAAERVAPGGLLAVSFWQLADSERLMERTVKPSEVGLTPKALKPNEYLLRWGDGEVVRYCHHCGPTEATALAGSTSLTPIETYRADGKGGGMNLYWLLSADGGGPPDGGGPADGGDPPGKRG